MIDVYLNKIGTAVPPFDIHNRFVEFAPSLLTSEAKRKLFKRMAERANINHRYSFLSPGTGEECLDADGFYQRGHFPDTTARMRFFEQNAIRLIIQALEAIGIYDFKDYITHLIVVSSTGFIAPGLDIDIVKHFQLTYTVERTVIGLMGCYAALNAFKLARHIVRSVPTAKVVIVSVELCTLHMQETDDIEQMLCYCLFGDGCSASLVSATPVGLEMKSFHSTVIADSANQMSIRIGHRGLNMFLSGSVPHTLGRALRREIDLAIGGLTRADIKLWAVHAGGRSVLDAVDAAIDLDDAALDCSREVLRCVGNISSATITFILKKMMDRNSKGLGCGMAFGPGLAAESMIFEISA
jgi:alpha-pyrone synthase